MRRVPSALMVVLLLVACSGDTQEQADLAGSAGPDSIAMALEQYSPTLFDSITWATDTAETNRGAVVWLFSCRKCHGETGRGDARLVVDGDTIVPPDFHTPGWRFATDREGLLKYIYTGNEQRMPHWGIEGLKPRDVSAVGTYIQKLLIPAATQPAG